MRKSGRYGLLVSLLVLIGSLPAGAQQAAPAEEIVGLEEIRVVGSRSAGRSAADSPVPVDVIDADSLRHYGSTDMNDLLSATVPSYKVFQYGIGVESALVRPAKLRGLPPDSTLVLVNGKRRHRSSAITRWSYGLASGSHGTDIASIPSIALKRVEVLRDGAGAQYGSDAVAGVLNFVLRDAPEGGSLETNLGQYYHGDGDRANIAANIGLPLTEAGFANLSFEFTNADSTSRSVQRDDARRLIEHGNAFIRKSAAQVWGAPDVKYDYKFFGNLGLDLGDEHRLYAFGNYAEREIEDTFYWRNPASFPGVFVQGNELLVADLSADGMSGNCPTIATSDYVAQGPAALAALAGQDNCYSLAQAFPGGFTPRFRGVVNDWSLVFGLRGSLRSAHALLDGWDYDLSAGFGQNSMDTYLRNSVNPNLIGLKAAIPTQYRTRRYEERDKIFNLDLSRPFDTGLFASALNVAFGLEYREETFESGTGEPNSYLRDDGLARQGLAVAVSGHPGTSPAEATQASRDSFGAYLDLEADVLTEVLLTAAGRFEHHAGIGESLNGKLAARWNLLDDSLALRGSIGTNFRAPTVGQANYRNITSSLNAETGELDLTYVLSGNDPIAQQKGGKPLSPEHSTSFSLGAVITLGNLSVTADYYNMEVRRRIMLSQNFLLTAADKAALAAAGIDLLMHGGGGGQVSYFNNDFSTTTQGLDVVATYPLEWLDGRAGATMFTFAGNWNTTKVDTRNPQITNDLRAAQIENTDPEFRFTLSADHSWGPWRLLTRLHYYDDFKDFPIFRPTNPVHAHARALLDLEASYTFFDGAFSGVRLALGAQNLFDTYPTRNKYAGHHGMKYPVVSPYGYNGGLYYLRAGFEWG